MLSPERLRYAHDRVIIEWRAPAAATEKEQGHDQR